MLRTKKTRIALITAVCMALMAVANTEASAPKARLVAKATVWGWLADWWDAILISSVGQAGSSLEPNSDPQAPPMGPNNSPPNSSGAPIPTPPSSLDAGSSIDPDGGGR